MNVHFVPIKLFFAEKRWQTQYGSFANLYIRHKALNSVELIVCRGGRHCCDPEDNRHYVRSMYSTEVAPHQPVFKLGGILLTRRKL